MSLDSQSLYAILKYRGDDVSWHWALCLPGPGPEQGSSDFGAIWHATNDNPDKTWMYEARVEDKILSDRVVLAVKLADLSSFGPFSEVVEGLGTILEQVPVVKDAVNRDVFSCRTWLLSAVSTLHETGYFTCDSAADLEREIRNSALLATHKYLQDREITCITSANCS